MKKLHIRLSLIITSIVLIIALGIYHNINKNSGNIDKRLYAQAIRLFEGFDNILEDADVIATGTVNNIVIHDEYDEYFVTILNTKKGDDMEQITVRNYLCEYTYMDDNKGRIGKSNLNYEIGKSYIFILQHIRNVYEDMYIIMSDAYIPLENAQNSTVLSKELRDIEDCEAYIDQYHFKNIQGKGIQLSIDYIESSQEKEIVAHSKYIAKVEVNELYRSTEVVDVYACSVVDILKGKINTAENQMIIPFFKDTVEIGEIYLVCLNSDRDDAIIYTLSSKNSVFESSKFESIKNMVEVR